MGEWARGRARAMCTIGTLDCLLRGTWLWLEMRHRGRSAEGMPSPADSALILQITAEQIGFSLS